MAASELQVYEAEFDHDKSIHAARGIQELARFWNTDFLGGA
jgi:hypothetical protein